MSDQDFLPLFPAAKYSGQMTLSITISAELRDDEETSVSEVNSIPAPRSEHTGLKFGVGFRWTQFDIPWRWNNREVERKSSKEQMSKVNGKH